MSAAQQPSTLTKQRFSRVTRRAVLAGALSLPISGVFMQSVFADQVTVETGSFVSRWRAGRNTTWIIVRPVHSPQLLRPVIHLHGLGGDHSSVLQFGFSDILSASPYPYAVVGVDGGKMGEGTYFHPRRTGEDSAHMIIEELLPLLEKRSLDTSRIALHGISMGGFGALRIGALLGSPRVAAISAVSPALWPPGTGTAPGAFDSVDDHRRYSGFELLPALSHIPVRIDCGESDPFAPAVRQFISGMNPAPAGGFSPGSHDATFWQTHLPQEMEWIQSILEK